MAGRSKERHQDRIQGRRVFEGQGPARELIGHPIRIEFQPDLRLANGTEVHASTFIRKRKMILDDALRRHRRELRRIVIHEIYHFVWVRLGNSRRTSWEDLLAAERGVGELGWSAEWRREALRPHDRVRRTRRWREYCCESFCDTAAWLLAGLRDHEEFTLSRRNRVKRAAWFSKLPSSLKV